MIAVRPAITKAVRIEKSMSATKANPAAKRSTRWTNFVRREISPRALTTVTGALTMLLAKRVGSCLVRDREEAARDHWSTRRSSAGAGRRIGGRRTVLRLEEIRDVPHRIDRNGLRAPHRRHRRDDRVLVARVLVHDRHAAIATRRDVDELL